MNSVLSTSSEEKLNLLAIRRLSLLVCSPQKQDDQLQQMSFYFEAGQLGYRVKNLDSFTSFSSSELSKIMEVLREMRGGNVKYVPLFKNFPTEIPNDVEYFWQRIYNFYNLSFAEPFDKNEFGACPILQRQDLSIWKDSVAAQEKKIGDSKIQWLALTCLPLAKRNEKLISWLESLLYAPTAINDLLWDDVLFVSSVLNFKIDFGRVKVKETLARLAAIHWQKNNQIIVHTPTDFLRVLAYLQKQDVTLAEPFNLKGLKFSKPQRKEVVRFLASCSNLEEDLLRYKGLWISLSKWIHPGDYVKQFPKVAKAFDALRKGEVKSFIGNSILAENKLSFLASRPGVFFRQLSQLLSEFDDQDVANEIQKRNKNSVPLQLLLTTHAILQYSGPRLAFVKSGKSHTIPDREMYQVPEKTLEAIKSLILQNLITDVPWKNVWIDPQVSNLVLPLQTRKQSEGLLNLARGSRISITSPVIRLFTYWKQKAQRTDLDLAVLKLDSECQYIGHVSWNSYGRQEDNIAFSGDVQDAKYGAAEFIDLRVEKIGSNYILAAIKKFSGENFTDLECCYAGWMEREKVDADVKQFDSKTVKQKVNVSRSGNTWIPFIFDVQKKELVYADLYSSGSRTIENDKHFGAMTKAVLNWSENKPTYGTLLSFFMEANGIKQAEKNFAEYTIGIDDDCDLNVLNLQGDQVLKLGL